MKSKLKQSAGTKAIKTMNRAMNMSKHIENTTDQIRGGTKNQESDSQSSSYEYASDKVQSSIGDLAVGAGHVVRNTGKMIYTAGKRIAVNAALQSAATTKTAIKNTATTTRATEKVLATVAKAVVQGSKSVGLPIVAGCGVAVVIVMIIMMTALVSNSAFGIYFAGETVEGTMQLQNIMQELDAKFQKRIDTICCENYYDKLELSGAQAAWPEVLAVYAVRVTTDPDNPRDVATIDTPRRAILEEVFWDMTSIDYYTETIDTQDDSATNTSESTRQTTLYLTIAHKTAEEMAGIYQFDDEQMKLLNQILQEAVPNRLWRSIL